MKIAFFEVRPEEKEALAELMAGPDFEVSFYEEKLKEAAAEKAKGAQVISVFMNSEIRSNIIGLLPDLKFIVTRSTGFDHIDLDYCKKKGIKVSNVPAYGSKTVAEFTFALLLDLSRKVSDANRQIREKASFNIANFKGFDLLGKTLGVIGTGKIGKNVVKIAKGFGMKVLATDLYPDAAFAEEVGVEYVPLDVLLSASDIVTIHAPYNETTHHLINKDNIKQFKKGAYLINTARGEIVDTEALLSGLKEGIIAGAGLDVLEGERKLKEEAEFLTCGSGCTDDFKTLLEDRLLMGMPNVVVTPHIAFYTREAVAEILKVTAENIKNFISGNPQNLVK